jgi:hypothetical protein
MTREDDLTDLRWHWGDAYDISVRYGMFRAVRRDDGAAVTATTAEHLLAEIHADYRARPVPRDPPVMPPAWRGGKKARRSNR